MTRSSSRFCGPFHSLGALFCVGAVVFATRAAIAAETEGEAALPKVQFSEVTKALAEERYADAIATSESMADRGYVDAAASFNRGLAYASRARSGAEVPGDLGRAAHGFEEAKSLAPDRPIAREATQALSILRGEVARRRAQHGSVTDLDKGASLGRTVVSLFSENGWAIGMVLSSILFGLALYVRMLARDFAHAREVRLGAIVCAAVFGPLALGFFGGTLGARYERRHFRDGVIVTTQARPAASPGAPAPNAETLPEAAHVEVGESQRGYAFVRWGVVEGWVPISAVRTLAR
jgi:hypothetical protein